MSDFSSISLGRMTQALLGLAVLAAIAAGAFFLFRSSSSGGGIEIILPTSTVEPRVELKVHISGAVRNPGVYQVEEGDRLVDVVEAAGGATEDADLSAVNLAERVADEDHWHIPGPGESVPAQEPAAQAVSKKIDLNSATADELTGLPGIGPVKAESIVRHRENNGPFSRVDDLLDVSGIGTATLDSIRELVEVR